MRDIKQKFFRQVAAISTASLILVGSAWQEVQAQQRTTSLFSTNCIRAEGASFAMDDDVVIGREVFTRIASIPGNGASITCRIRPAGSQPSFATLRLAFGVRDYTSSSFNSSDAPRTLKVYVDGSLVASRTLSPGQRAFLALDVSRASSVALENSSRGQLYDASMSITQALLEPISSSPGRR